MVKVAIINYGMGNIASVEKAIKFLGYSPVITSDPLEIEECDYIILPGVGAFTQGMENLKKLGLIEILEREVLNNKKPFLGICLGMQLLATRGFEPIETNGLNWIEGEVIKINESNKTIPHLGWNNITARNTNFVNNFHDEDFYFIHSYHFKAKDDKYVAATVNYGSDYVAIIHRENIFATQFHPEKSQTSGLNLLKEFFTFYAKN